MPGSSQLLDPVIRKVLSRVEGTRFLDLGCGSGKYAWFLRELRTDAQIEGYEIDPDYVRRFDLCRWYDIVNVSSCLEVLDRVDDFWDVVTIGDCIEHLKKSDGIDLIHFLLYRCRYLLICWPEKFLQNSVEGHRHEAHISSWDLREFSLFEHGYAVSPPIHMVLLDGFLPHNQRAREIMQ